MTRKLSELMKEIEDKKGDYLCRNCCNDMEEIIAKIEMGEEVVIVLRAGRNAFNVITEWHISED